MSPPGAGCVVEARRPCDIAPRQRQAVSSNKKTTEPQWREFIEQWQLYAKTLRGQLAIDNAAEEEWAARRLSELSPEQRQRLEKLREEAENARAKEPDG